MKKRPFKQAHSADVFFEKLLKDPEVRILYDKKRIQSKLSRAIRQVRSSAHLTQVQLAKKADTTQGVIARIESGSDSRTTSLSLLARIAGACGTSLEFKFKLKKA